MRKIILPSNSFIADVAELKERCYIHNDLGYETVIYCAICGETSDKKDLWFILKDAGSGSMDDYICSDCINKIKHQLDKYKLPKPPKVCQGCNHIFEKGERKVTLHNSTTGKNIYFCKSCYKKVD